MIYDVCIIGSGAGGAPIAYELSKKGYSAVVLEKGKYYREADFSKDEIAICRRDEFTPNLDDEYHVIEERNEDGSTTRYIGKEEGWSFWNGSMVGGSSNLMSGYFHRLKPDDFRLKSIYGKIEGANVEDWIIGYEDLEPYYTKVENLIGASGEIEAHRFLEPRSTENYPFGKLEENETVTLFDNACKSLGLTSLTTARAILSTNALDRNACSYSNFCGSYPCATGAKGSARAALLQKCNAKIVTEAFVYKLESDDKRVTKALYFDKDKKSHSIEAKLFVLSAQPIETSRLLLNSKNPFFPNGLANNSGNVGKNLIFSAGGSGSGRFYAANHRGLMMPGLFFNRNIQDLYEIEYDGKTIKGGLIDFLFEHPNIISRAYKEIYDNEGTLLFGEALEKKIKEKITGTRVLTFEVFNDWLPTDHTYVGIDAEHKDKYGINVGRIHLFSHLHDRKVGEILAKKGVAILKKMGADEIDYAISYYPPPNLVAGGCRFGNDPASSVLDKNCKTHELDNLYISDASFMPTGGSVPYTFTIYANAFRVADAILKRLS